MTEGTHCSCQQRCRPPRMRSFITSYELATLLNTSETRDGFSCRGTDLKPKSVSYWLELERPLARAELLAQSCLSTAAPEDPVLNKLINLIIYAWI